MSEEHVNEQNKQAEEKDRRGLFGAKKRERNNKTVLFLYVLAGVYLVYTSFMSIKSVMTEELTQTEIAIHIGTAVLFLAFVVYLVIKCIQLTKMIREEEEELNRKAAQEYGEEIPESTSLKESLKNFYLRQPTAEEKEAAKKQSVSSRAAVYYNPADEDEEAPEAPAEDGEAAAPSEEA